MSGKIVRLQRAKIVVMRPVALRPVPISVTVGMVPSSVQTVRTFSA
jgi:hypothetical protein